MKKYLCVTVCLILTLTLLTLASCSESNNNTVSLDGSTSMEKVIGALGESFKSENEGIKFTYNPTGSGSGIKAVSEVRCDIGLSSRKLKDEEKSEGLKETVLAYDGIAVIVNIENTVSDIDLKTLAKIFTGEIIYNLCDNALKYNVPGGSVRVSVSHNETYAEIDVSDTGIGISPEDRERIFERFYRGDKSHSKSSGGTGLGLSIVKHAVLYHGGKVTVESEPLKGSCFKVILPLK